MNKVYKIVWNKALGVWVVVSELAKAGKKSSKVTVVGGILVLSAVQLSHAEMVITDSNGTSTIAGDGLYIENGPTLSREVFDANGLYLANLADGLVTASSQDGINGSQLYNSMSNVATAIGKSALIDSNTGEITVRNVAGTNQNTIDDAISFVKTTADNALKTANLGLNFSTNGANPSNIPLGGTVDFSNGKNTTATYNSSIKSYQYSVVDAPNFAGKVTAQGFDASNQVISNVANGVAPNDAVNVEQLKAQQTHYYSVNDNGSTGANYNNDGATGKNAIASGVGAVSNSENGVAIGSNVNAETVLTPINGPTTGDIAIGSNSKAAGGIVVGSNSSTKGIGNEVVIGNNNTAVNQNFNNRSSVAIGYNNSSLNGGVAIGANGVAKDNAVAVGYNTSAGFNSVAIGDGSNSADYAIAIGSANAVGTNSVATGLFAFTQGENAVAVGRGAAGIGANAVALGNTAVALGDNTTALGNATNVSVDKGVALGASSVSNTAAGAAGYDPKTSVASTDTTSTWKSTAGAVSIGDSTNNITRQITGVAAGSQDTDAVNLAQLKAVQTLASSGWTATDGTTPANIGPGGSVKFTGDNNVAVQQTGTDNNAEIAVNLNKNIDLTENGSVAVGDTLVNSEGLSITNGPSFTATGIDAAGLYIANVGDGLITAQSKDAVNGSQLYAAQSNLADLIGPSAMIDSGTGEVTAKNIGGTTSSTIDGAIGIVKTTADTALTTANKGLNFAVNGGTATNLPLGSTLNMADGKNTKATFDPVSKTYKYDVVDAPVFAGKVTAQGLDASSNKIENVAAGQADTDAVNVQQLNAVDKKTTEAKSTVIAGKNTLVTPSTNPDGSTEYKVETADDVDFNSVTVGAIRADATTGKITGLTAGTVTSDSKDAINGSQLYGVSDSFKTVIGGNAAVNPDGTVTTSNIGGTGKDNVNDAIQAIDTTAKAAKSTVIAGKNTLVTPSTNPDGSTEYKVETADDVDFNSVTVGTIRADATSGKITGLTAGTVASDSKDAINGSQLYGVSDSFKTVIGGNAAVNPDGTVTTSNIGGTGKDNVNDAIQAIDTTAKAAKSTVIAGKNTLVTPSTNPDGSTEYKVGTADDVDFNSVTVGTIRADATTGKITGLTAGTVASDSKDAINGSQLYGVSDSFKTVIGGNAVVNPDGTLTTSNIGGTGKDTVNDAIQAIDTTAKAAKSTVIAGKNTLVTPSTNPDGSTEYKVETADDVDFNSVTASSLTVGSINADASSGKITGLTAGTVASDSKDAINGSQLYGVSDSFKTVIGGNAVVNPDGTLTTSNIGGTGKDTVNDAIQAIDTTAKAAKSTVIAGKNTLVTPSTNPDGSIEYKVETADDVDFNSVTASSLTVGSINAEATTGKITGLTAGTVASDSKDAINGSQLYGVSDSFKTVIGGNAAVNPDGTVTTSNIGGTGKDNVNDAIQAIDTTAKAAKSTVIAGKNTLVTPTTNPDGLTEYKVETADDVDFNSVTVGTIRADATTGKITGLTAGTVARDSKDAINGSQLYGVSDSFKTVIGGNAAVNPDGTVITSNIGGTGKDNVNDAIQAIDTTAKAAKSTVIAGKNTLVTPTTNPDGSTEYKVATADDVDFNSVTASSLTVGSINADATTGKITGLTAGTVASDSKDAINGSQLYGVSDSFKTVVGGNAAVNPDGTVTTSNIGGTGKDNVNDAIQAIDTTAKAAKSTVIAGKNTLVTPTTNPDGSTEYKVETADDVEFNSVTVGAIRADATTGKITGLTAGTVASDSKDAINGSQLYGVSDSFKTVIGGNAAVNPDGTVTTSNIGGTGKDNVNDAIQAIDTTAKAAKSTVIAGKNTLVTPTTNPDGSTEYKVETADDVDFNSVTVGTIRADAATGKIVGVSDGLVAANSLEVVNGGQLFKVADSFKTVVGGNAIVNPDGTINVSNIGGTDKDNVNDAIQAIDTTAKAAKSTVVAGKNTIVTSSKNADGSTEYAVATADDVNFKSVTSDKITVGNIVADASSNKISGLANGAVSKNSTEAINGSQLYGVSNSVSTVIGGNSKVNADGTLTVSNLGNTGKDNVNDAIAAVQTQATQAKSTVSSGDNIVVNETKNADGSTNYQVETAKDVSFDTVKSDQVTVGNIKLDSNSNKITGIENGTVSKDSKDAINGSQLSSVSNSVANVIGGNTKVNSDGTLSANDIGGTGKNTVDEAIASVKSDVSAAKTTVSAGTNTVVNKNQNTDGSTNYTVDLAKDIAVDSVTAKDVKADNVQAKNVTADNVKVGNVTVNSTTNKVSGLANGEVSKTSTDAVNGSQLHATNQNMATYLGGGSTVNTDGSTSAPTYNVAGGSYHDVGSALNAVDGRVSNLEQAFYQTNQNMQDLRNETRAGIAGALAVGNLPQPTEAGMSMISAGVGGYRGETAVAVGVSAITDSNKYVWKMGASADSRSNISGAVSVGYQWK
ncbi:ESPR-type extended signal peptide-containing protein [Acinetobacter gerneri]|uniref:ESPR-type extended signal peptide-containing protein n=1 Tax=Acinetobacter gerneri TaxID=202952 RepID=UPI0029362D71|nr:ESPR-type extended signal peptide-containing protein [Acinetobacter gerneri]MDV2441795.1 ESPR-type extended signal peptide-containing protein [Acinetobacter gerneri]